MLTSMTGFGRAQVSLPPAGRAVVEIHTLNHRFLEVECRLPDGFQGLEESIRGMVARNIQRGRVRISLILKARIPKIPVVFQADVARQYVSQLRGFQRKLGIPGGVTLEMILALPQVVAAPERDSLPTQAWPLLKSGVSQALTRVVKMRRQEGKHLRQGLSHLIQTLGRLSLKVKHRLPLIQGRLKEKLTSRIQALAPAADPRAMVAEVAGFVQATDVSEELARIESHLAALRRAVEGQVDSPGRTMDFLAQELHREVNTLGTKLRDGVVVGWVVAMKNQIEKLREQAANVE